MDRWVPEKGQVVTYVSCKSQDLGSKWRECQVSNEILRRNLFTKYTVILNED